MRRPQRENIVRIDGKDKKSLLILRESVGISREHFSHEYASELLRSSLVCSISALDRYMHDVIVDRSWTLLSQAEKDVPKELKKVRLPVLATKKALEKLKSNPKSRPGTLIKKEIQNVIHIDFTFQKKSDIEKGAKLLGITDFWRKVSAEMPNNPSPGDVQDELTKIAKRRNQIVHESDLILKTSAKEISQRDITRADAENAIDWVTSFVQALDEVFYP
ncbi:HEPN domain-containing protein [Franzmannia qiaohouensis]|uniref:HEPN domain-containing protein n=1 Tax=Franzmannia qiaohouensis TaxID=1329370 RepID=A0ABU1HJF1_9GAMM|nr:HEPN domain-containing protein [Halomonas qiaohouensis]MDR5907588.1 HEPN domain-containing protein [Halomonas qiaohouensis]